MEAKEAKKKAAEAKRKQRERVKNSNKATQAITQAGSVKIPNTATRSTFYTPFTLEQCQRITEAAEAVGVKVRRTPEAYQTATRATAGRVENLDEATRHAIELIQDNPARFEGDTLQLLTTNEQFKTLLTLYALYLDVTKRTAAGERIEGVEVLDFGVLRVHVDTLFNLLNVGREAKKAFNTRMTKRLKEIERSYLITAGYDTKTGENVATFTRLFYIEDMTASASGFHYVLNIKKTLQMFGDWSYINPRFALKRGSDARFNLIKYIALHRHNTDAKTGEFKVNTKRLLDLCGYADANKNRHGERFIKDFNDAISELTTAGELLGYRENGEFSYLKIPRHTEPGAEVMPDYVHEYPDGSAATIYKNGSASPNDWTVQYMQAEQYEEFSKRVLQAFKDSNDKFSRLFDWSHLDT